MVWSKVATLTTSYDWDEIWNDSVQKRTWGVQQFSWIKDQLINECGWLYNKHPNYSENINSTTWGGVLQTPQMTDLWTGVLTRYAWWFLAGNSSSYDFSSSPGDPMRWSWYECRTDPANPGTNTTAAATSYGACDGATQGTETAGRITAWTSDLRPGALLVLNGQKRLIFYWPGPNELYRPYASDPDPWKYQGIFNPWMSSGSTCSAGNPANEFSSTYYDYGSTKLTAMINPYRMATGASNDRADPAAEVVGSRLYQDFWMVHSLTYQPYFKMAPDVLYYEVEPIFGGLPYLYGYNSYQTRYMVQGYLKQFDGNYWLSLYNFWFNMGPTVPDFGGAKWDD